MMTHTEFDAAYARLVALHGCTARDASGKRAQSFARLYVESGWTQEELAKKEKMSQQRMYQWLIYGEFLLTTNCSKAGDLYEGPFRALWLSTNRTATKAARLAAVGEMLEAMPQEQKPERIAASKRLGKQLIAQFSDGKFHRLGDMAEALNTDMAVVRGICDRIVSQGTFQTFGERRPAPPKDGSYAYRFVKGGKKKIDLMAFSSEVQPVLDDMEMILNGPRKTDFSREAMQTAFAQLLKVLDSVAR